MLNRRKLLTGAAALAASSLVPIKAQPLAFDVETDIAMDLGKNVDFTSFAVSPGGWKCILRLTEDDGQSRMVDWNDYAFPAAAEPAKLTLAHVNAGIEAIRAAPIEPSQFWNRPPLSGRVTFAQITERYKDLLQWEKEHG